jgi:hypothetical protein
MMRFNDRDRSYRHPCRSRSLNLIIASLRQGVPAARQEVIHPKEELYIMLMLSYDCFIESSYDRQLLAG